MKYSAKKAAEAVGKSVPTITRATKSGKLSAEKTPGGGYSIDPSELFRVYPSVGNVTPKVQRPVRKFFGISFGKNKRQA